MISIIVAIAENAAIGFNNQLLCHLPGDLRRFRRLTLNHTVIMGKRTWESLPNRPLKDRRNIVITDVAGETFPGCEMAYSIDEAIRLSKPGEENFIIGGASVYRQFLPHTNRLYITRIHRSFQADAFFPEINFDDWNLVSSEEPTLEEQTEVPFSYLMYERKT